MCCLLQLWTLVRTLVKCICLQNDKCHDDVVNDVMVMSCGGLMMSWMMS